MLTAEPTSKASFHRHESDDMKVARFVLDCVERGVRPVRMEAEKVELPRELRRSWDGIQVGVPMRLYMLLCMHCSSPC